MVALFILALLAVVGLSLGAIFSLVFFVLRMVFWMVFFPIRLLLFPLRLLFKLAWLPVGLAFGTVGMGLGVIALPLLLLVFGGVLVVGLIAAIIGVLIPVIPFVLLGFLLGDLRIRAGSSDPVVSPGRRGARPARREERAYPVHVSDEQRRPATSATTVATFGGSLVRRVRRAPLPGWPCASSYRAAVRPPCAAASPRRTSVP